MALVARLVLVALCLVLTGCGAAAEAPAVVESTQTVQATSRPIIARASPSRAVASPSTGALAAAASGTPGAVKPSVYAAIGASDTVGVGANDPEHEGWVPRFARLLGPSTSVLNLGVSGTLTHTALLDQLPQAVRAQPTVVTVWLAVDDFDASVPLTSYSADLDIILGTLQRQTRARVLVANVPNLLMVPAYHGVDPQVLGPAVELWNAAIADAALRHNAQLVDLYAAWTTLAAHPELISPDGFHPSSAGYVGVAQLFYTTWQVV